MSQNLYLGADLTPIMTAATSGDLLAVASAVGEVWNAVQVRDFPARAETIADQIAAEQPDLVGLQEVSQFIAGNPYQFGQAPEPGVSETIDYLAILEGALESRGLHYAAVATTAEFTGQFPALVDPGTFTLQDVQFTDRDVILARTDLPTSQMKLSNVQEQHFATNVEFSIGGPGETVTFWRGWNSVDVQTRGKEFRLVNTHLVEDNPISPLFGVVQTFQAMELLAGPANAAMSVVMVGDFNSKADGTGTPSYSLLVGAGFSDAWSQTHPGEPGYTWGDHPDLRGDPLTVDAQRIDFVLYRGDLEARAADLVLDPVEDPTSTGPLWPSDHAALVATLGIHVRPSNPKALAAPAGRSALDAALAAALASQPCEWAGTLATPLRGSTAAKAGSPSIATVDLVMADLREGLARRY